MLARATSCWIALATLYGCAWGDAPSADEIAACVAAHASTTPADDVLAIDERGALVSRSTREPYGAPRGVGSYPLLEHAGSGRMTEVNDIFDQAVALGRPLVRTHAFFDGGASPARIRDADGTLREEGLVGLDRVLAAAREHEVRLVLVLTNHWPDYGGARAVLAQVAPGEDLPVDAFYSDPRAIEAQRAYIDAIVRRVSTIDGARYAETGTVLAWELVNEARCDDERYCDGGTLVRWARVMADAVRAAGARQLVAWGGSGHLGEHGEDLAAIARDGAVDVLTLHVYPGLRSAVALDADTVGARPLLAARLGADAIRERAAIAREARRPLLVEEMGWRPIGGGDADAERALVLDAWMRAAQGEGAGALPWMIAEQGRPDYDGFLIRAFVERATTGALACD